MFRSFRSSSEDVGEEDGGEDLTIELKEWQKNGKELTFQPGAGRRLHRWQRAAASRAWARELSKAVRGSGRSDLIARVANSRSNLPRLHPTH